MTFFRFSAGIGLVVVAGLLTGCSHSSAPAVASLASETGTTATAPTAGNADQGMIDYAKCMRGHGVTDYPDPVQQAGHSGLSLQYQGNETAAPYPAADGACKHFIAALIALKENGAKETLTVDKLTGLAAYARCMRRHQVPMLDPDASDGHLSLGQVAGADNSIGRRSPQFTSADTACRALLPAGTPDDGTGPP